MAYGCDGSWWKQRKGLPKFAGTKLAHDTDVCARYRDVHKIEVREQDRMIFDEPGVVGSGGNSGFMAINLVAQFGASRIMLVGFDMHAAFGVHWHGPHGKNLINPTDVNFARWRQVLNRSAGLLNQLGIDVVNVAPESALTAFPKMTIDEALRRWGLLHD